MMTSMMIRIALDMPSESMLKRNTIHDATAARKASMVERKVSVVGEQFVPRQATCKTTQDETEDVIHNNAIAEQQAIEAENSLTDTVVDKVLGDMLDHLWLTISSDAAKSIIVYAVNMAIGDDAKKKESMSANIGELQQQKQQQQTKSTPAKGASKSSSPYGNQKKLINDLRYPLRSAANKKKLKK